MLRLSSAISHLSPKTKYSNPNVRLWIIAGAVIVFIAFILYVAYQLSQKWF